jgi:hypothetical protein
LGLANHPLKLKKISSKITAEIRKKVVIDLDRIFLDIAEIIQKSKCKMIPILSRTLDKVGAVQNSK